VRGVHDRGAGAEVRPVGAAPVRPGGHLRHDAVRRVLREAQGADAVPVQVNQEPRPG
jgi:hypothetical protein